MRKSKAGEAVSSRFELARMVIAVALWQFPALAVERVENESIQATADNDDVVVPYRCTDRKEWRVDLSLGDALDQVPRKKVNSTGQHVQTSLGLC